MQKIKHYEESYRCNVCKKTFLFKTNAFTKNASQQKDLWNLDVQSHHMDCVNKKVEKGLNENR